MKALLKNKLSALFLVGLFIITLSSVTALDVSGDINVTQGSSSVYSDGSSIVLSTPTDTTTLEAGNICLLDGTTSVIYVKSGDYSDLVTKVENSVNSTVFIPKGSYTWTETINVPENTHIILAGDIYAGNLNGGSVFFFEDSPNSFFEGYGGKIEVDLAQNNDDFTALRVLRSSGTTVQNADIEFIGQTPSTVIEVGYGAGSSSNLKFLNNRFSGYADYGFASNYINDTVVDANTFENWENHGLATSTYSYRVHLTNNVLVGLTNSSESMEGIRVHECIDCIVDGNTIVGSTTSTDGEGIEVGGTGGDSLRTQVSNNIIKGFNQGIVVRDGSILTDVSNNKIWNTTTTAINLTQGAFSNVDNNDIYRSGTYGIYSNTYPVSLRGNSIYESGADGMYLNIENSLISDNHVYDSGRLGLGSSTGILFGTRDNNVINDNYAIDTGVSTQDYGIVIPSGSDGHSFIGNRARGNAVSDYSIQGSTITRLGNYGLENILQDDLNLNGNDLTEIGVLSLEEISEITINQGNITVSQSFHSVDTESDSSTDSVYCIYGGVDGMIVTFHEQSSDRDVTFVDQQCSNVNQQLRLSGNFVMDDRFDTITMIYQSGNGWYELSRSDN